MKKLIVSVSLALSAAFAWSQTKVLFSFDTEDFTCDRSNDAIRDIANLLTEEDVRGNFNIVGYLADWLVELKRNDVIEALKLHVIGSQTYYHSLHPDLAEIGDDPDYKRAYELSYEDGRKTIESLERIFGKGSCAFWCPPGDCVSPAAMDAYVDLGVMISGGCGMTEDRKSSCYPDSLVRPGDKVGGLWYFNQLHIAYCLEFHLESMLPRVGKRCPDFKKALDSIAKYDVLCLYMHPHMAVKKEHWDGPNFKGGNLVKWGEWVQVADRDPEDTKLYYQRFREFIRAMKADRRFQITDFEELKASIAPRRKITTDDMKGIREQLLKDFNCIREPASWSVADVFQAAVQMLRGKTEYVPGKVYGFLSRPQA